MKRLIKKGKTHTIYAIFDEPNDELVAVSLDYSLLEMQLQLGEYDTNNLSVVEFDIRLT